MDPENPPSQREINEAQWRDTDNWSDPLVGFYFSKRDTRVWVPKRRPWMGYTLNLAHPAGARWMLGLFLGSILLVTLLMILALALRP